MTAQSTFSRPTSQVLVYKVDYPRSIMLLEEYIKQHNDKAISAAGRIKVTHQALAEKLIRLFRQHFAQWQALNGFIYNPATTPLPTLRTNNEFLAKIMGCTSRTIRNYRDRLEALDLITTTILHGSNASFELVFNPNFLWVVAGSDPLRILPPVQNFPHTSSCTLPEPLPELVQEPVCGKNSTEVERNVDNSCVVEHPHQDAHATAPAQQPEQPQQPEPNHRNESSGHGTGTPFPVAAGFPTPPASPAHRQAARFLVAWALRMLWPGQSWNVSEKLATEQQVDRLFAPVSLKNLPVLAQIYTGRCQLATKLWTIETGQNLPSPWDFFNPDNPHGFRLTRDWPERQAELLAKIPPTPPPPAKRLRDTDTRTGETRLGNLFTNNQFQ